VQQVNFDAFKLGRF